MFSPLLPPTEHAVNPIHLSSEVFYEMTIKRVMFDQIFNRTKYINSDSIGILGLTHFSVLELYLTSGQKLFYSKAFDSNYQKMSKEIESHILDTFEIKHFLGSGAYGYVWKVLHRETGKEYALKKIFDAFQNDIDSQRTYRQITILHQLQHQNIVKLEWVIKALNGKDIYLVFQFMETDLHLIIGQDVLGEPHIRYVIYQLSKVLKYLHSAQLIHRDLKTSNILIDSKCQIKLCDFGLVKSLTHEENSQLVLTQDVATRWYRSPEILLGSKSYGTATDMWSLGCILAQMVVGEPIFPGSSNTDQIERVLQFTGIPSKEILTNIGCQPSQAILNQLKIKKRSFKTLFSKCNGPVKDLILRMLEVDATKRITAEETLQLPMFKQFRKSREYNCQKFIHLEVDDNKRLDLEQYRRIIYKDIQRRYPQLNRATRMPRIFRSHHSCNIKDRLEQPSPKKPSNSLYKVKNSTSLFHKSYLSTMIETPPIIPFHQAPKKLVSIYNNPKQYTSPDNKPFEAEDKQNAPKKIFKRRVKRNIWKKQDQ